MGRRLSKPAHDYICLVAMFSTLDLVRLNDEIERLVSRSGATLITKPTVLRAVQNITGRTK